MMSEIEYDKLLQNIATSNNISTGIQTANRYACPHCASVNTIPVNSKTVARTAVGGIIGGILTGLITYFVKPDVKNIVKSSIVGVLGGASVGVKFGQSAKINSTDKMFLCLDCLHSFNRD
jgi:uncharacterized protein YcfJ